MHITTQRNQIISWLVRKVQPEKFCYVASCSVGALQQEKKKLKKRKARTKNMCEVSTPFEFELKLGCKKISYPLL